MLATDRFQQVEVESTGQLHDWLALNHVRTEGVWLVTFLKSVPERYVGRWDVLDELLCFGWIDGIRRKLGDRRTMQLISPRRKQVWAESYKVRVERLEAEGRMCEPGRAAVERSKQQGLWNAQAAIDALTVPEDLRAALRDHPEAEALFAAFAPSYRRNVLRWLASAKRPDTRARRIADLASLTSRNQKMPQM